MITVYTLAYNEEVMIQFMIDHYRARFPNCRIVMDADRICTDNTIKIALANGCEVLFHYIHGVQDEPLTKIKNNCWKEALTDWVLICDLDELLDINEEELKKEEQAGTTIIRSELYSMIAMDDKLDLARMKYAAKEGGGPPEKCLLFNKRHIHEINYGPGAHSCNPIGNVEYSKTIRKIFHYCFPNYEVTVEKYRLLQARMNSEDRTSGLYKETPEEIRALYTEARNQAVKVR